MLVYVGFKSAGVSRELMRVHFRSQAKLRFFEVEEGKSRITASAKHVEYVEGSQQPRKPLLTLVLTHWLL